MRCIAPATLASLYTASLYRYSPSPTLHRWSAHDASFLSRSRLPNPYHPRRKVPARLTKPVIPDYGFELPGDRLLGRRTERRRRLTASEIYFLTATELVRLVRAYAFEEATRHGERRPPLAG